MTLQNPNLRIGLIFIIALGVIGVSVMGALNLLSPNSTPEEPLPRLSTPTLRPTSTPEPTLPTSTSTPIPTPTSLTTPTLAAATPALPVGGIIYALSPDINSVGWVQSDEEDGNHFGESFLYAGWRDETHYFGAMQFNLSFIPSGSTIFLAELELTGLADDELTPANSFQVNILTEESDADWSRHNFEAIQDAVVDESLTPILKAGNLAQGQVNTLVFNAAQRSIIEKRLENSNAISFRVDSLTPEQLGWFGWDSGYGEQTRGHGPVLRVGVLPPVATEAAEEVTLGTPTPTPTWVIITSTPTPENVQTLAAVAPTMTYEATVTGTPTPLPPNWVTPAIITVTPTPENAATAQFLQAEAAAAVIAFGTFTPTPSNMILATPVPPTPTWVIITSTPTPENIQTLAAVAPTMTYEAMAIGTSTPLPPNWVTPVIITVTPTPENAGTVQFLQAEAAAAVIAFGTFTPTPSNMILATPVPPTPTWVIITSTPTPENIQTLAAVAPTMTYEAMAIGTSTPLPPNWVTPVIITVTPTPENAATAQFLQAEAAAAIIAFGAFTPTPSNMVLATSVPPTPTATATPIFIVLEGELPLITSTLEVTRMMEYMPEPLLGKIAFKSDRTGREEYYVINPDGSGLALLTNCWAYALAEQADAYSADGRFRVFTKNMIRYRNVTDEQTGKEIGVKEEPPAVYWYDAFYKVEEQLTNFGSGLAYSGVLSPMGEQIAFVSNSSGDDEIWTGQRDGSNLLQLTASNTANNAREIGKDTFIPEVNRHPSWSPDGSHLVFWSNRTGHGQIYVMNADGSNLYSLSRTGFNDYDPVWVKYAGLPVFDPENPQGLPGYIGSLGSCAYNPELNCTAFNTQAEAQALFTAAGGPLHDPYGLDLNRDGRACDRFLN